MNSITIYMAQRIFSFSSVNKFFLSGLAEMRPEPWAKVLYAAGYVAVCWLFLYFLYKKKIFLKI
jgi:predicted acyltransferase